jgi:hypothetical protein
VVRQQARPRLLALACEPSRSLADALAEAIRQVASLHPGSDLTHPGTPSATVVLLRALNERADYLALADATLLLDTADGLKVITDARVNQLAGKERAAANQVPTGSALKLRRRVQLTGRAGAPATGPAATGSPRPVPRRPARPSPYAPGQNLRRAAE